ncbi:hypothetical protein D9613_001059 [Agrocybe pediades]|uniref:BTB domain-containing protein n=1 Tax=Agrocybe pediades TaxID=84607 RepID=A0A8H4R0Z8_9AGAR|nr:hypothetical protein D9613_001059 [Agrocybe pediades]
MALDIPTVSSDSIPPVQRDEDFFIENITFKVEDTLFCVPKMGFLDPECFFAGMFDLPGPGPNGEQVQGAADDCPIILEGESKAHFKAFLKVLYQPLYCSLPKPGKSYDFKSTRAMDIHSYDEWVGVLHLSTKWYFANIRQIAIEKISRLIMPDSLNSLTMPEACNMVALARKYNVRGWLLEGYRALVDIHTPHIVAELVETMGLDDALKLLQIRDTVLFGRAKQNRGWVSPLSTSDPDMLILEAFASEFATMEVECGTPERTVPVNVF